MKESVLKESMVTLIGVLLVLFVGLSPVAAGSACTKLPAESDPIVEEGEKVIDGFGQYGTRLTMQLIVSSTDTNRITGIIRERAADGSLVAQWDFPFLTHRSIGYRFSVSPDRKSILRREPFQVGCSSVLRYKLFLVSDFKDPARRREELVLPMIVPTFSCSDSDSFLYWLDDRRVVFLSEERPEDGRGRLTLLDVKDKTVIRLPYVRPSKAQQKNVRVENGFDVSRKHGRVAMITAPWKVTVLSADDLRVLYEVPIPEKMREEHRTPSYTYLPDLNLRIRPEDGGIIVYDNRDCFYVSPDGSETSF